MEDAPTRAPWFYREGGVVLQSRTTPDPVPMIRFNAYAKTWRGEQLSEPEQEALASADPAAPFRNFGGNLCGGDAVLGVIATHCPQILQTLDQLADQLAGLGMMPVAAWSTLEDYCERATRATAEQSGLGGPWEPDPEEAAFNLAWEALPEGAAADASIEPDGGPEGWSQVPPTSTAASA